MAECGEDAIGLMIWLILLAATLSFMKEFSFKLSTKFHSTNQMMIISLCSGNNMWKHSFIPNVGYIHGKCRIYTHKKKGSIQRHQW